MEFKYHPPTRTHCPVCEELAINSDKPITSYQNGKSSSANNFSVHNWYNFVLGYSPDYPNYIIKNENLNESHYIMDPFMGSGTTLVCCKEKGIPSIGIDANDYFFEVAT